MLYNCLFLRGVIVYESEIFHTTWLLTSTKFYKILHRVSCLVLVDSVCLFVVFVYLKIYNRLFFFNLIISNEIKSHKLPEKQLCFIIRKLRWKKTKGGGDT